MGPAGVAGRGSNEDLVDKKGPVKVAQAVNENADRRCGAVAKVCV